MTTLSDALKEHAKNRGLQIQEVPSGGHIVGRYYPKGTSREGTVELGDNLEHNKYGPGVLAHELGHHDLDQTTLGRLSQGALARVGLPVVGLSMGALIAMTAEHNQNLRAAVAAGAVLLAHTPMLANEILASIKGHRILKDTGATPEELKDARTIMLLGGSSYLARSLGSAALAATLAKSH